MKHLYSLLITVTLVVAVGLLSSAQSSVSCKDAITKKDYYGALACYEQAIKDDPSNVDNYYWVSKIYCHSSEKIWGMIYGEIFLNLEPNTPRATEISKLLFETYRRNILINDAYATVRFSKNELVAIQDEPELELSLNSYEVGIYEKTLISCLDDLRNLGLHSLHLVRERFLNDYFSKGYGVSYPNIVFDYQKKLDHEGLLEAYNYWILKEGYPDQFVKWVSKNQEQWNAFIEFQSKNPLAVTRSNNFQSDQYEPFSGVARPVHIYKSIGNYVVSKQENAIDLKIANMPGRVPSKSLLK